MTFPPPGALEEMLARCTSRAKFQRSPSHLRLFGGMHLCGLA